MGTPPSDGHKSGGKFAKEGGSDPKTLLMVAGGAYVAGAFLGLKTLFIVAFLCAAAYGVLLKLGAADDQSILSIFYIMWQYRNVDFPTFLKTHDEAFLTGGQTGNYVPGVCNYYELMSDLITLCSGPFWHFVPMTKGKTRKECHDQFHHTTVKCLGAKKGDKILEFGCGYGEIGRQVAKISGAGVKGLTMADAEIVGGNARIKEAGLQDRCEIVQGNYHDQPFENNSFDKVFGIYTLKYSADLPKAISEAARVLKPGGKFMSYEIIVTDKYDPKNKAHKEMVHNISYSTCMPPLAHAKDYRDAAKKAGLVLKSEVDLCAPDTENSWYSCFEQTGVHSIISSPIVTMLIKFAEAIKILPVGFTKFYDTCLIHPAKDFVDAGRLGIIDGALCMVWEKPK